MKTILHIDDDTFLLKMYGEKFKEHGYDVISTDTLEKDFVSQIAKLKPDLIVSDIVKPYPNGFDIIKAVKADDRTKNIPFVFLTNSIDTEVEELSKELGAYPPIHKATSTPHAVAEVVITIIAQSHHD